MRFSLPRTGRSPVPNKIKAISEKTRSREEEIAPSENIMFETLVSTLDTVTVIAKRKKRALKRNDRN